ncbi:MAG TPA: helix-hairpin-helix domain-containing protein [Kiritimatiellia bacterium]|nr:helix-hairpin-helix domain-containing protein [Kiritimatiellia bacterium]
MMKNRGWIGLAMLFALLSPAGVWAQSELIMYRNAVLVEDPYNDGDSFYVEAEGKRMHLRLYFVDTPETVVAQVHDARRVQEQARYFGIERPERIVWLGDQASAFSREILAKPFTVYTAHARAPGGSRSSRIYAFIVTSTGRDLGELLVENGLARNFGVSRQRYDGLSHQEVDFRLRDMEIAAKLKRIGIWSESNPEMIVNMRAQQREEARAMQAIMESATRLLEEPLDLNSCSQRDLERIPGIGPATAQRIIASRPYRDLDELKNVRGIGDKLYESVKPYLSLPEEPYAGNG